MTSAPISQRGHGQTPVWVVLPDLAGGSTVLHMGTLIVFLLAAGGLWGAADSRVVAIGAPQAGPPAVCKIPKIWGGFFAQAGGGCADSGGGLTAAPARR